MSFSLYLFEKFYLPCCTPETPISPARTTPICSPKIRALTPVTHGTPAWPPKTSLPATSPTGPQKIFPSCSVFCHPVPHPSGWQSRSKATPLALPNTTTPQSSAQSKRSLPNSLFLLYKDTLLSLNALATTDTLENAIAPAANIGDNC